MGFTEGELRAALPAVRRWCYALTQHDHEGARDLAQDTCERAWRKRHLFTDSGRPKALENWLAMLARNIFIDQTRRNARAASSVYYDHYIELDRDNHPIAPDNPEVVLRVRDLRRLLKTLPAHLREIVLLHYRLTDGHRAANDQGHYQMGANLLGLNLGTYRSRLSRGRERLRCDLEGAPPRGKTGRRLA